MKIARVGFLRFWFSEDAMLCPFHISPISRPTLHNTPRNMGIGFHQIFDSFLKNNSGSVWVMESCSVLMASIMNVSILLFGYCGFISLTILRQHHVTMRDLILGFSPGNFGLPRLLMQLSQHPSLLVRHMYTFPDK